MPAYKNSEYSLARRFVPTSALRVVALVSVLAAAYSGLAVWKEQSRLAQLADFPAGVEAAISLVIGLLLAFRANRAFDRWWEARTLWGCLVNACRNLAVKTVNAVEPTDPSLTRFHNLLVSFPFVLRDHLREGVDLQNAPRLAEISLRGDHVPSAIVTEMYRILESWQREQQIGLGELLVIDREARLLLDVCGACERIRNTPIAASYRVFLNHALAAYLLTLPWGIVESFGIWTIPIVFLTSYFMIAAEGIAEHVEHPFQANGDGLDLDQICLGIEASVDQIFAAER